MAELSRPAWLDDDFLKTCIKNSRNLTPSGTNNIKIESVVLDYAVPRGENFLSVLYRVHVKYCLGVITLKYTESFIVKVSHEEKNLLDLTRTLFDREIDMYTKVIPAMHVIMDDTRFACRSLCAIINSEPLVLVLEDLSPEGYGLGDRCKGLDLKHYKLALKKLAKYHASSKIFYDTLDDASKAKISAQPIKDNGDENGRETQRKFKERSLKKAAQIIEELSTYADKYATSIKFFESYLAYPRDYTSNICPAIPGNVFDTISHSDFWVNNIMFKYSEDGSPEECVFVDLQMSHLTSVSQDFLYFFVTSSDPNVKLQFAELKQYYFEKFLVNLKNLGFKGKMPTMNDFQKELQRGSLIVISALTNALPIILGKRLNEQHPDETSLDDLISSMDKNDGIYNDTMTAAVEALQDNRILDKYPRFSDLGDIDCSNGVWYIDLQGSHYTSIAYDFLYLFFASANLDVRENHFVELKKLYVKSLDMTLKALRYRGQIPTLESYNQELKRCLRVAIFALTMLLPACLVKMGSHIQNNDDSEALSVDEIAEMISKAPDDGRYTSLVLASSDIMQEEHLFDVLL